MLGSLVLYANEEWTWDSGVKAVGGNLLIFHILLEERGLC